VRSGTDLGFFYDCPNLLIKTCFGTTNSFNYLERPDGTAQCGETRLANAKKYGSLDLLLIAKTVGLGLPIIALS